MSYEVNASEDTGDILIVDDQPDNLKILQDILENEGYKITIATSGKMALQLIERNLPELVLLDIMMPKISGFDACITLKSEERTKNIPIIFISGLADTENKVKAFEIGGVDYITKPFEIREVLARVSTHLENYRLKQKLEMAIKKEKEIAEFKDEFTNNINHELRNPLTAIMLSTTFLLEHFEKISSEKIFNKIKSIHMSSQNLLQLVNEILDFAKLNAKKFTCNLEKINLNLLISNIEKDFVDIFASKELYFKCSIDKNIHIINDSNHLVKILNNLLSNAYKFTYHGGVLLSVEEKEDKIKIVVQDTGIGIRNEDFDEIFLRYGQTNEGKKKMLGTGVGLHLVKRLTELHGGGISIESEINKGTKFIVLFPKKSKWQES